VDDPEKDAIRDWVRRWKVAGDRMAALRREELRSVSTPEALEVLAPLFAAALQLPLRTTSGLVIQQALFRKLRHD
jgi:hypothetical protein